MTNFITEHEHVSVNGCKKQDGWEKDEGGEDGEGGEKSEEEQPASKHQPVLTTQAHESLPTELIVDGTAARAELMTGR